MSSTYTSIKDILNEIKPADGEAMKKARARLDSLVKPPGSLGLLEDIAARLSSVTGELYADISKRLVIIMCADNGVVAEGVSSAPQQVTLAQTINFTRGITAVSVLAKQFGADLMVVDVGINSDAPVPGAIDKKVRRSTGNITKEPAMTEQEAVKAVAAGIEAVREAKEQGHKLLGAGEMGIGNTTTASAVLCALLGYRSAAEVETTVGKGAGLSEEGFGNKVSVIMKALLHHKPDRENVMDILRLVGGLDIAAMTGVYIGAAMARIPVVIDGFISAVAALCAVRLNPNCADYMFASHHSYERGFSLAMEALGLQAPLKLEMRLGEGSGCPIMFSVMDAACVVVKRMATFEEASISEEYLDNIKNMAEF